MAPKAPIDITRLMFVRTPFTPFTGLLCAASLCGFSWWLVSCGHNQNQHAAVATNHTAAFIAADGWFEYKCTVNRRSAIDSTLRSFADTTALFQEFLSRYQYGPDSTLVGAEKIRASAWYAQRTALLSSGANTQPVFDSIRTESQMDYVAREIARYRNAYTAYALAGMAVMSSQSANAFVQHVIDTTTSAELKLLARAAQKLALLP